MTQPASQTRIAFLGTGLMGAPMARRLVAAGYAVTVWNRSRAKAEGLVGASIAESVTAAVGGASIVISMLQDGIAVREVAECAIAAMSADSLWIDMSSTAQSEALSISALLAAAGIAFIDAPVSGGVAGAERGELAIMVGGDTSHLERAEPVLRELGRPTHVGPVGCGQLAKLCNQLIVGGTLEIVAEALLLAKAGGGDPAAVRAAIRGGFAESRILEVHGARMLERNFLPGGQVKSQVKDLDNVLAAAAGAGLRLPLTEVAAAHFRSIVDVLPQADHSAALLALERLNEGMRLGDHADQLP